MMSGLVNIAAEVPSHCAALGGFMDKDRKRVKPSLVWYSMKTQTVGVYNVARAGLDHR
jgi:hypothetical protein